jgi:hypothetical protein
MTIYIDDSGASPVNAVAVAAGWIAHTDSWVDFQANWDKARDIDGDKFDSMHMAEFVNLCLVEGGQNSKDGLLRKINESQLGFGALSRIRRRRDSPLAL